MNNLIKFTDWADKKGYGKIRVPIDVIDVFVEYLDYLECDVKNLDKPLVSYRYLFWFEDEGKEGWTFEIEANDSDEAYEKAFDTHGPQVENMMYQLL